MAEALCGICGISAERVIQRSDTGIIAVPSDTARDGHVMVVSAKHARSFSELLAPEADALMSLVGAATRAVEETTGVEKCYVMRIGDKHAHLHFHIVPTAEADAPLGPHVFGDQGWSARVDRSALPEGAALDVALRDGLMYAAPLQVRNAGRLPVWLVSLSLMLLAFGIAFALAWATIGPPMAGPLAMFVGFATGQALDDHMRGVPGRWTNAGAGSAIFAAVFYLMSAWLRS